MYPRAATVTTPAKNTRSHARPDRTFSTQTFANASALDATMVRAPSPTLSEPTPHDARAAEAILRLPPLVPFLPAPTPDAVDRTSADRDLFRVHSPAPIDLPIPVSADPTMSALLGFMSQIQSTLLSQTVSRQAEARALDRKFEEMNKRFEELKSACTNPESAGASAPHESRRATRHLRPNRSRAESSLSDRSPSENREPNVFPRKRVPPPIPNVYAADVTSAPTALPPIAVADVFLRSSSRPVPPSMAPVCAPPDPNAYSLPESVALPAVSYAPAAIAAPSSQYAPLPPATAVATGSSAAELLEWSHADRETLLKAASRHRYTEASGQKIRAFLDDAEFFLTLCNRPRNRWGYFVLSWLGTEEADKVRRCHYAVDLANYDVFRKNLESLFSKYEFEGYYRAQLRVLRQSGSESVAAFAARTTDLCSRAYPDFGTENQVSLAVDHFIAGLADVTTRDHLQRERASRVLNWPETVRSAQASEASRLTSGAPSAAAVSDSTSTSTPHSVAYSRSRSISDHASSHVHDSRHRHSHSSRNSRNRGKSSARQTSASTHDRSPRRSPAPASSNDVATNIDTKSARASKFSQSTRSKSRIMTCYRCGARGHIAKECTAEENTARKCYECHGFGHLARDCPTRLARLAAQQSDKSKSANAVASAGVGAPQLFASAEIDGVRIEDALIDTGSAFSMMSSEMYSRLALRPPIHPFEECAPDIIGVGGASAAVRGYVDIPLRLAGIEVAHPLLVVENLSFALLIGTDILRPHAANLSLAGASSLQLRARVCEICLEQRTEPKCGFRRPPVVAWIAEQTTIGARSAAIVKVQMPESARENVTVALEPIASSSLNVGCATLPAVCSPSDGYCRVAVVNLSPHPIELPAEFPIASVKAVEYCANESKVAATAPRLSREEKFRKVVKELRIESLPESAPHKKQLLEMIDKFLDAFAESDADVGTTELAFHEIDTGDVRPLRQPVRRIPYGEMRKAVESEIEKLVSAKIARPSTSPWASPVVIFRKKDGGWRMCVDYRRLNSVTKFDCFPLPRLDEALDAFAGAAVFSSLDLAMAYHQVPVKPADVEKTAFIMHVGLFEMRKMPFGLCNAPSTYQRLMTSCPTRSARPHMPRVFGRCDRLLEATARSRCGPRCSAREKSKRRPQTEALEVRALPRSSTVPRTRDHARRSLARSREAASAFRLARAAYGPRDAIVSRVRELLWRFPRERDRTHRTALRTHRGTERKRCDRAQRRKSRCVRRSEAPSV